MSTMDELAEQIKQWNRRFVSSNRRKPEKRDLSPGIERMLADFKRRKERHHVDESSKAYQISTTQSRVVATGVPPLSRPRSPSPRPRPTDLSDDSASEDGGSHVSATPEICSPLQNKEEADSRYPLVSNKENAHDGNKQQYQPSIAQSSPTADTQLLGKPRRAAANPFIRKPNVGGAVVRRELPIRTARPIGNGRCDVSGADAYGKTARSGAACRGMVSAHGGEQMAGEFSAGNVESGGRQGGHDCEPQALHDEPAPCAQPRASTVQLTAPRRLLFALGESKFAKCPIATPVSSSNPDKAAVEPAKRQEPSALMPNPFPQVMDNPGQQAPKQKTAAIPKVMPKSLPALVATKGGTKQPARLLNLKREWSPGTAGVGNATDANQSVVRNGKDPNFVRTHLKGKRGMFSYKMVGGKTRSRRGRTCRHTTAAPQAGDGVEYEDLQAAEVAIHSSDGPGLSSRQASADITKVGTEAKGSAALGTCDPSVSIVPVDETTQEAPTPHADVRGSYPGADCFADVREDSSESNLLPVLSQYFGYSSFRGGQLQVVQSVLKGQSTLAILPTGGGKSLCYQLPALILPGLCLVISPLVALMKDQLARLPPCLPGAMIVAGQSAAETRGVLQDIANGEVKVLYVSPERLLNPDFLRALGHLPELCMVCVDEAHCVAEWGHNFRPAFFRLGHLLRDATKLRFRSILALTATATRQTEGTVCDVLGISQDQVIRDCPMRENLRLAVSRVSGGCGSNNVMSTVGRLLSGPLKGARCIVYCGFQAHAEQMAKFLFVNGAKAEAYHAGMTASTRSEVQTMFCSGRLRIICATVAFGMGIDTQVDAVIHACMPRSLEEYVQQVGRAGRDGKQARCVILIDDEAFLRLRSLTFGDCVDESALELLLTEVFAPSHKKSRKGGGGQSAVYGILPRKPISISTDIKEEVIETVLAYLQSADERYLRVLPDSVTRVDVMFYKTPPAELAQRYAIASALLATTRGRTKKSGANSAAMADICAIRSCPPAQVIHELRELAVEGEIGFTLGKVQAFAYQIQAPAPDVPALAADIAKRLRNVEEQQVRRMDVCYQTFAHALKQKDRRDSVFDARAEAAIRSCLNRYFQSSEEGEDPQGGQSWPAIDVPLPFQKLPDQIRGDAQVLNRMGVGTAGNQDLSDRAIARVLHGLSSPGCNLNRFRTSGLWGRYQSCNFTAVLDTVRDELATTSTQCAFEQERDMRVARNKEMLARMLKDG